MINQVDVNTYWKQILKGLVIMSQCDEYVFSYKSLFIAFSSPRSTRWFYGAGDRSKRKIKDFESKGLGFQIVKPQN